MCAAYVAIDWGTTNRRVYAMAPDGTVLNTIRDDRGVLALKADDYLPEVAALRARFGDLPVIAAGMVGSSRGWCEAPYVAAPVDLESLACALLPIEGENVSIVPGVSVRAEERVDVMRGEEVQVLGAVARGLAPADALFCQPGTHNKWVRVRSARITDFTTAMTGELFSLLHRYGSLAEMLGGPVADDPAFRAGVARGSRACDLTAALFEVRASVLLGTRRREDAAAYTSGLLIGQDVGSQPDLAGNEVHLLASGDLAELYAVAIAAAGARIVLIDSHAAFVAGVHRLWELTR